VHAFSARSIGMTRAFNVEIWRPAKPNQTLKVATRARPNRSFGGGFAGNAGVPRGIREIFFKLPCPISWKAVAKVPFLLLSVIETRDFSTFRPNTLDMIVAGARGRPALTHVYGSFTSTECSEREVRRRTLRGVQVGYEQADHEQR